MDINETNIISINSTELLRKQMRFIAIMQQIFGVIAVIGGAISCLGIITAIIGVPVILGGIKLFKSGNSFSLAANLQKGDDFVEAITNLHGYWKFQLITFICSIIFFILYIIILIVFVASFAQHYH